MHDWIGPPRSSTADDIDFRPLPLPGTNRCLISPSSVYYIAADTSSAETCWQWLRFISERIPEGFLPPRQSLLTSDTFRDQVGADAQDAYLETLKCEGWVRLPDHEGLPRYSERGYTWLEQALEDILWNGADAQAKLSEAQRKAEAYLECLRQRDDPEDEASAEACFEQVDAQ
jgi:ABC-type glycerol-3-phosphate transport system substrate-binding protein